MTNEEKIYVLNKIARIWLDSSKNREFGRILNPKPEIVRYLHEYIEDHIISCFNMLKNE